MLESTIKLGDRVVGRKTGYMIPANVICIMTSEYYLGSNNRTADDMLIWNKYYTDWQNKAIIVVQFDEPQKHMTLEELYESLKVNTPDVLAAVMQHGPSDAMLADILKAYWQQLPLVTLVAYPIDDLEIL